MDKFGTAERRLENFPRQKEAHDSAKNLGIHRPHYNMMNALAPVLTNYKGSAYKGTVTFSGGDS